MGSKRSNSAASVATLAATAVIVGAMTIGGIGAARAEMTDAGKQAVVSAGRIMFEHRCRSCHADDPASPSYGPSLVGVFGRKAGSVAGFAYSDALKSSGVVWDEPTLKSWMADNKALMPGTRMRHVGVTDADEQMFLLAYLKSLVAK
jgi:cytochrome c